MLRGAVTRLSLLGLSVQTEPLETISAACWPCPGNCARKNDRVPSAGKMCGSICSPGVRRGTRFTDLFSESRQRLARNLEDGHSERLSSVASSI